MAEYSEWNCRLGFVSQVNSSSSLFQILGTPCSVEIYDLYDRNKYVTNQIIMGIGIAILCLIMGFQIIRMIFLRGDMGYLKDLPLFQLFVLWEINLIASLITHVDYAGHALRPVGKTILSFILQSSKFAGGYLIVFKIWVSTLRTASGKAFDDSGRMYISCQIVSLVLCMITPIDYLAQSSTAKALASLSFGINCLIFGVFNMVLEGFVVSALRGMKNRQVANKCSFTDPLIRLLTFASLASLIALALASQLIFNSADLLKNNVRILSAEEITASHSASWMTFFIALMVLSVIILGSFRNIHTAMNSTIKSRR